MQLRASRQWLDLLPWSSPALERERNLHDSGKLAYDLGACDLVPLQLRLRLHGNAACGTGVSDEPGDNGGSSAVGAMEIIREVLRCNPGAYRDGERGRTGRGEGYGSDGGGGAGGAWEPEVAGHQDICFGASEVCFACRGDG